MILRASDSTARERERERESYQDISSSQLVVYGCTGWSSRAHTQHSSAHRYHNLSLSLRDHRKQNFPPARYRFGAARTSLTAL